MAEFMPRGADATTTPHNRKSAIRKHATACVGFDATYDTLHSHLIDQALATGAMPDLITPSDITTSERIHKLECGTRHTQAK